MIREGNASDSILTDVCTSSLNRLDENSLRHLNNRKLARENPSALN